MVTRWLATGFSHAICSTPMTAPARCCGFTLVCVPEYSLERAAVGAHRQVVPGAEVRVEVAEALRHPRREDELMVAEPHRGVAQRVGRVEAMVLERINQRVEVERPGRLGVVALLVERGPGDADAHVPEAGLAWATGTPGRRLAGVITAGPPVWLGASMPQALPSDGRMPSRRMVEFSALTQVGRPPGPPGTRSCSRCDRSPACSARAITSGSIDVQPDVPQDPEVGARS